MPAACVRPKLRPGLRLEIAKNLARGGDLSLGKLREPAKPLG